MMVVQKLERKEKKRKEEKGKERKEYLLFRDAQKGVRSTRP